MKSWRIIVFFLFCLVLTLVASVSCNPFAKQESNQQVFKVTRGDLQIYVSGSGKVQPTNEAKLTFASAGKIAEIMVEEGDKVSKGDIIARLDTDPLNLALAQARVGVTQSQANVESAKLALSRTERTAKWSEYDAAKADVDDAKSLIDYIAYNLSQVTTAADMERWSEALRRAQTQLATAQAKLDALLAGYDTDEVAIRKLQVTAANQALEQAKLAQAQAEKQLAEATIKAPFDGIVAKVNVKKGDAITTLSTIVHLIDPSSIELDAQVDEIDILQVKVGQEATITSDSLPDTKLSGKVTSIAVLPNVEAGIVSYPVTIAFNNPKELTLKIGMSATADLIIKKRSNVLLIPTRAVHTISGKTFVSVMVGQKAEEKEVVTGISDGIETEIVSGLAEGDSIVIESRTSSGTGGLFGGSS